MNSKATSKQNIQVFLSAVLVVLGVYLFLRFSILSVRPERQGRIPTDYVLLHVASENLAQGKRVYNPQDESPYKYSPTFLLFFSKTVHPLLKLKTNFEDGSRVHREYWGWLLWSFLSIVLLITVTHKLWKKFWKESLAQNHAPPSLLFLLSGIFLGIFSGWHGLLEIFSYGQCDILIFAFYLLSIWCEENAELGKQKSFNNLSETYWSLGSSFFAAAHVLIKPQSAILWSIFLIRKKDRWILQTLAMSIVLFFLPVVSWGPERFWALLLEWKQTISQHQGLAFITGSLNQNFFSFVMRLIQKISPAFDAGLLFQIFGYGVPLSLLSGVGLCFWLRKKLPQSQNKFPILLSMVCFFLYQLLSPLSWRWLTFSWVAWAPVLYWKIFKPQPKSTQTFWNQSIFLSVFGCIAIFSQQSLSRLVGIHEPDTLSYFGLYLWGNVCLFLVGIIALFQQSKSLK